LDLKCDQPLSPRMDSLFSMTKATSAVCSQATDTLARSNSFATQLNMTDGQLILPAKDVTGSLSGELLISVSSAPVKLSSSSKNLAKKVQRK
jgi:hypothetical protein